MTTKAKDKTYAGHCDHCLQEDVPGAIHCWRLAAVKALRGMVGCHQNFGSSGAYWAHIHRGGCRSVVDVDKLRWDGVSWNLKEEEDR